MKFETKIAGIPCICHIIHHTPVISGCFSGPPENCYPDEGGEFYFEILDRNGRTAHWLERKITCKDKERLYSEFLGNYYV